MPGMDVPPTKSSLRRIKNDLEFAYEGFELLEQKREILVMEIMQKINRIKTVENNIREHLDRLYDDYRKAAMDMGSDMITMKSLSEKQSYELGSSFTKLMGLVLPEIEIRVTEPEMHSGIWGTTASYDLAKKRSIELLKNLGQYASLTKSIFMLSRELKKVQRRVNALEKIFIPQHEEAKKYITERLEEMEREELFVKKMISESLG